MATTIAPPPRALGEQRQILTLPNRAPWKISHEMFEQAVAELGITGDVHVSLSVGRTTIGCHRFVHNVHSITISKLENADQAGQTLWHELTHAMQCERYGSRAFDDAYRAATHRNGYRNNRFEREAQANESRHYTTSLIEAI